MDRNQLIYLQSILVIFLAFIILQQSWIYTNCIPVPVVINNTQGGISNICITSQNGKGIVWVRNLPIMDSYFQYSIEFAKLASCSLEPDLCEKKNYFIEINSDSLEVSGPSGSAAIALLILGAMNGKKKHLGCTVTGFVLPSGLLLPIGGLEEKEEGTFEYGYTCLIAPNRDTNVTSIGTLPVLYDYFYNDKRYVKGKMDIPYEYSSIIEELALDICKDIDNKNVTKLLNEGFYYSAASLCYGIHSKGSRNFTKEDIIKLIKQVENTLINVKCSDYNCKEIVYQVKSRLNDAKKYLEEKDYTKAYWRAYTAKQWMKFLDLKFNRKTDEELVEEKYKVLYTLAYETGLKLKETLSYFEMKEEIAKVEAALAMTYYKDYDLLLNRTWDLIEFYLSKYGFSVSAYNYYEYSKGLSKIGDKKSSIYYAFVALEYSLP